MTETTKQQWLQLSRQLRENTTPRELGEAVLSLAQGKRARRSQYPKLSNHIAIMLGIACVLLISGWGWTNNQLASQLQDSLDNEKVLIADLQETLDRETELRLAAETVAADAEAVAAEKIADAERDRAFVARVQSISRQFLQRGRDELMKIRQEDPDQEAGEPFMAIRVAGEIMRQGQVDDPAFRDQYNLTNMEVLTQLARYLFPNREIAEIVIIGD